MNLRCCRPGWYLKLRTVLGLALVSGSPSPPAPACARHAQPRVSRRGCQRAPRAARRVSRLDGDDRLVKVLVHLPLLLSVAHGRRRLLRAKSAKRAQSAQPLRARAVRTAVVAAATQAAQVRAAAMRAGRTLARAAASTCAGWRAGRGRGGPPYAPMLSAATPDSSLHARRRRVPLRAFRDEPAAAKRSVAACRNAPSMALTARAAGEAAAAGAVR